MSEREDHDRLADKLQSEADRMEHHNEELEDKIGGVRQDWESKRRDERVPGAPPPPEDSDRDAPGDEVNPEDAEREEHRDEE